MLVSAAAAAEATTEVDTKAVQKASAAVVKIFVTRQRPSLAVPWQTLQVESSSGSGTYIRSRSSVDKTGDSLGIDIEPPDGLKPPYWHCRDIFEAVPCQHVAGDLVLTAAHVVADARDVRVQMFSQSGAASREKYAARIVAVAHDCDLALLEVVDEGCFTGVKPMQLFGPQELLEVMSRVQVIGFPVGGDYLSITEGVLSRIEVSEYSHSRRSCLALTVDAAINAGNSGGPVVDPASGRLLAVAHQKIVAHGVENQGQAVPPCLIWRFLYGLAHGRFATLPCMGAMLQVLESPTHRDCLKLAPDETGILVSEVSHGPGETASVLQVGDVLLQVGDHPIDNFGQVYLLGHRVSVSAVQDLWYLGDAAKLRVRRGGEVLTLDATLRGSVNIVPRSLYGEGVSVLPDYFIFGGLVFIPLTADFLDQAWPNSQDRPVHLMELYFKGVISPARSEAVVLLSILSDDINAGFGSGYIGSPLVERVGGKAIANLQDLAAALQQGRADHDFVEIDLSTGGGPYNIVLRSSDIAEADARIQELYQIPRMASPGLLEGLD